MFLDNIEKLKEEFENISKEKEYWEDKYNLLRMQLDEMTSKVDKLCQENQESKNIIDEYTNTVTELTTEYNSLVAKYNNLLNLFNDQNREFNRVKELYDQIDDTLEKKMIVREKVYPDFGNTQVVMDKWLEDAEGNYFYIHEMDTNQTHRNEKKINVGIMFDDDEIPGVYFCTYNVEDSKCWLQNFSVSHQVGDDISVETDKEWSNRCFALSKHILEKTIKKGNIHLMSMAKYANHPGNKIK